MRTRHRFLIILILSCCTAFADAQGVDSRLEAFRKFATVQMKENQVPGMTIGYIQWGNEGEDIVWIEAFGYSDLENQVPARLNSGYRLGSVSKPMTAAAVLLLAEQGKIDLDAEVQKYVPYFPKKKWPVTVRQVLGHIGGISHYKDYKVEGRIKEHKNTREAIAIFENFDLVAEPGTKYSYSSYGYNLLAAVVEGASGMTFGNFMEQNIWKPLDMNETRLDDPTDLISNRVRGYRIMEGNIKNSEFVDMSSRLGGGGTRSTVPDLLRFAKGLIEGKILSSNSLSLMYSSMETKDRRFTDYSTGWGTRALNGHFMLRHTGSQQETATVLLIFPVLKLAIACAQNQEDVGASLFAQRLYELLTDEPYGILAYVTENQNSYRAIDSIFASGTSYYELHGKPLSTDRQELREAFDYFQSSIKEDSQRAKDLVADGVHPISNRSYTRIGSFMAKTLEDKWGKEGLKRYHSSGPIPFFADYMKICKEKRSDFTCAFPNQFTKVVSKWNESWSGSYAKVRGLRIDSTSNLDEIAEQLQSAFRSGSAYPDFSRELGNLTWTFLQKGKNEKSLQAGELGALLYPESARMLALYGITLAALADQRGVTHLRKAYQLDKESPAEPDWLTDYAEDLATAGKMNQAMQLMHAAVELYPNEPEVLSDMGEAYLLVNDLRNAREYFERVIALDPKNVRAKSVLEQIGR
jgi:CubicO group peptidase (beta-lactamase class C family)